MRLSRAPAARPGPPRAAAPSRVRHPHRGSVSLTHPTGTGRGRDTARPWRALIGPLRDMLLLHWLRVATESFHWRPQTGLSRTAVRDQEGSTNRETAGCTCTGRSLVRARHSPGPQTNSEAVRPCGQRMGNNICQGGGGTGLARRASVSRCRGYSGGGVSRLVRLEYKSEFLQERELGAA